MTFGQKKLLPHDGALAKLADQDPDIAKAIKIYGTPPDRSLPATFETLARSVIGQQISRSAAHSIWMRMKEARSSSASVIVKKKPDELMLFGLSRRKSECLIGISNEINTGRLNLLKLAQLNGQEVQKRLIELRGVGPWTADNFRLFALGDMNAWPDNDIALQEGMRRLKGLDYRPDRKEMLSLGEPWRPYRGAGALMLWHIYGILVRKASVADI